MVLARGECKISHTLNPKLIPNTGKVSTLIKLDLVGNDTRTVAFIVGVLQIPASLRLLNKLSDDRALFTVFALLNHSPDLQVFRRISVLVLGRPLPCYHEGSKWGEPQLKDVLSRKSRYGVAD